MGKGKPQALSSRNIQVHRALHSALIVAATECLSTASLHEKKGGITAAQPLEGGEKEILILIAVFVLLASSCSCVPAGVAGVPA